MGRVTEPEYDEDTGSWADYSSEFMFPGDGPGCTCEHDATAHGYGSCEAGGCPCEARWEHT